MAKINRRKEHSPPSPDESDSRQRIGLEDYTRTIRERDNGEEGGGEESRREKEGGRKTKLSIEPPPVDVGSTIIRIENRWWRGSHGRGGGATKEEGTKGWKKDVDGAGDDGEGRCARRGIFGQQSASLCWKI